MAQDDGWYIHSINGSHHNFKHPSKKGKVTIKHPVKDYKPGTYDSMMKQLGLK